MTDTTRQALEAAGATISVALETADFSISLIEGPGVMTYVRDDDEAAAEAILNGLQNPTPSLAPNEGV